VTKTTKNQANILFTIKDTGIGISKENKENIFLPYKQGNENTKKDYGGSGIGLAVVKDLLTLHKSTISIDSNVNQGTTFTFNIDFKIPEQEKQKPIITFSEEKRRTTTILLVEDDIINQKITKKIIQSFGLKCDIASNGLEAISMAKNKKYNLILMDIMMPEMNGSETSLIIKKEAPNTNIVALTGLSDLQSELELKKSGFKHILTKPIHPEELHEKLIKFLEN
jgi:CheY-like chemotaxis protein